MISMHHILTVSTDPGIALHDITPRIRTLVADSGMARGFLTVTSRHTTTAITINEDEERLLEDVRRFFTRLVPPGRPICTTTSGCGIARPTSRRTPIPTCWRCWSGARR